jgi:pimeloyl-ACP methyl ester carboxylesterase
VTPGRFVLLHGLAGSPEMWRPVEEPLAEHAPVVAPQLPWHGSAGADWARREDLAAELAGSVGPDDVVLAHSFSACLLLAHLFRHPERRPAGVALLSPFFRPTPQDFDWATMEHFMTGFRLMLQTGLQVATGRPLSEDLLHGMSLAVRTRIGPYGWMRFFSAYLDTALLDVGPLPLPVTIIGCDDDAVAPPPDAHQLHRRMPGSRLVQLHGGGHFPMLRHPAAVAAAALDLARSRTPLAQEIPA